MNFKPLSNHVFLEAQGEEKTTKSGIVLPDSAERERPIKGKVLAVGPGKLKDSGERIPMAVKVGQKVYFNQGWESEMEWKGEKYFLVHESDVRAILN